jgi:hypothetical protein
MPKHHSNLTFFGWVCLLLLASHALADLTVNVSDSYKSEEIKVAKEKHIILGLSGEQISQIEGHQKTLFVTVETLEGVGIWTLSGRDPRSENNQQVLKKIEGAFVHQKPEIIAISSESDIWEEAKIGRKVYLTVKNTGMQDKEINLLYVAQCSAYLDAAVGSHYHMHVKNLTTLNLRTKVTKAEGNHHYKFMFDAIQYKKDPHLNAEIYQESGSGIKGTSYKFLKFEQDRIGYVISQDDKELYCQENSCNYVITANLASIRTLDFYFGEHIDYELLRDGESTVILID